NIEKHSHATNVQILVTWHGGILDISVADNGRGFDPASVRKDEHFGLDILQERINALKGKMTIYSSADSGTVVSISVPT
ncbi:MAG TPA: ATP-binding protein, partial [Anaerolineales bacterium]